MYTRFAAIFAACFLLAACASQPIIPFDKSTAGTIKTIGVVTPNMPEQPSVWLASDIGQSFGLVGALIDAGLENKRGSDFWKEIDGANRPPRTSFNTALSDALTAQGYTVKAIDVKRSTDFLKTYPKDQGVDAYLDISFVLRGYGYVAAGMHDATPYRPFAYVNCRLVRASDNAVLMQDVVVYNYVLPSGIITPGVSLSPDPAYNFVDFDALKANPPEATKGLHDSLKQVANAIANLTH